MNSYVSVDEITSASVLDITGTGDDTRLRRLLEAASRKMDRYANRHFYALAVTRKFDGDGSAVLFVPDLISIDSSGIKTDDNLDRTFETTWATTDYLLTPTNGDPTTAGNAESNPYTKILVDLDAGAKAEWPSGVQSVQIAGQWGYWRHLLRATETITVDNATETVLDVSARTDIEAGHTILVESEQIYVLSYSSNDLTVLRGVNGTTAASHSAATVVDIYEYPEPVREAAMIEASRLWKRADSAFASMVGFPDGSMQVFRGMDPDSRQLMSAYRRPALGIAA